jgi:hypothetical protein
MLVRTARIDVRRNQLGLLLVSDCTVAGVVAEPDDGWSPGGRPLGLFITAPVVLEGAALARTMSPVVRSRSVAPWRERQDTYIR